MSDYELRTHLRSAHCWEPEWIALCDLDDLDNQHDEAHRNADRWRGEFTLYEIAYPHSHIPVELQRRVHG